MAKAILMEVTFGSRYSLPNPQDGGEGWGGAYRSPADHDRREANGNDATVGSSVSHPSRWHSSD